jgi:hypothetical protein
MLESDSNESKSVDAFEPLKTGSPEISRIIAQILRLEQERLYQKTPHLNDDILRIIKEEVK